MQLALAVHLERRLVDVAVGDAVALAAELGPVVESFFSRESGVMVMTDDETLQANRLRLLARVVAVTAPLGDLSQLQV
jgi:glycyl-tRNA synthetase beta subunit